MLSSFLNEVLVWHVLLAPHRWPGLAAEAQRGGQVGYQVFCSSHLVGYLHHFERCQLSPRVCAPSVLLQAVSSIWYLKQWNSWLIRSPLQPRDKPSFNHTECHRFCSVELHSCREEAQSWWIMRSYRLEFKIFEVFDCCLRITSEFKAF